MDLRRIFAILGGVFLALTGPLSAQEEKPPVVPFVHPVVKQVPRHIDLTGRIEAPKVELRARVTGYLEKVHIDDGAEVKAGDLLFEIDARPYRFEVERAEANLRVGEARLRRFEADLARLKALMIRGVVSQEELTKITAERAEAEAEMAVTKAALQLAKLNLEYTRVAAPVAGRIGRRLVVVGELVKADESLLGVLVEKPNRVLFDVSDRTAITLRRTAEKLGKSLEKAGLPVAFALTDEADYSRQARLDFVDAMTSRDRSRLLLGASLAKPDPFLAPGMVVRVRLLAGETEPVLEIPGTALEPAPGFGQAEESVLVLDAENRVQRKRIVLRSRSREGLALVESGLTEKDRVVPPNRNLKVGMVVTPLQEKEADPK